MALLIAPRKKAKLRIALGWGSHATVSLGSRKPPSRAEAPRGGTGIGATANARDTTPIEKPRFEPVSRAEAAYHRAHPQRQPTAEQIRDSWIAPKIKAAGFGPGILDRAAKPFQRPLTQVGESLYHTPGGVVAAEEAVRKDLHSADRGDYSFKRSRALGSQMGHQVGQDFAHPRENAGYLALDLGALFSAGAGTAGKLGAAGRIARAGGGIRAATRAFRRPALIHTPEELGGLQETAARAPRGRLSGVTDALTNPTRTIRYGDGSVQATTSPSAGMRALEHGYDRLTERLAARGGSAEALLNDVKLGPASRVGRVHGARMEREMERALAPAIPLQQAAKRLSGPEKAAYSFLKRYGPETAQQAQEFLGREVEFRQGRLGQADTLAERVGQRVKLRQLERAHEAILNPSSDLQAALGLGRNLTGKAQESRIAREVLHPETAAQSVHYPARLMAGEPLRESTVMAGPLASFEHVTGRKTLLGTGRRTGFSMLRPRNYIKQTTGTLYEQGRFRVGPKVTIEDFSREARAAQQEHNAAQAVRFSKPLPPTGEPERGHVLYNPEGAKTHGALDSRIQEAVSPAEVQKILTDEARAIKERAFPASRTGVPPQEHAQLRQIAQPIADAYEPGRPLSPLVNMFGLGNPVRAIVKSGLIYLKPAFVPANLAGDVGFLTLQQGPFWAAHNLAKSMRVYGGLSRETLNRLRLEGRSGAALAVAEHPTGPITTVGHKLASGMNAAASHWTRPAALLHAYAKQGVTSEADFRRLFKRVDEGDERAIQLNHQAAEEGTRAIIDYSHLPKQLRGDVQAALFILPWVYGATRYLLRMPLDHPISTAVSSQAGRVGKDEFDKTLGKVATWMEGMVPAGEVTEKLGVPSVPVRSFQSSTPFGTGIDVIRDVASLADPRGTYIPGEHNAAQWLDPTWRTAIEEITGFNTFRGEKYKQGTTHADIAYGNLIGGGTLAKAVGEITNPRVQQGPLTGPAAKQPVYLPPTSKRAAVKDAVSMLLLSTARSRDLNLDRAHAEREAQDRARLDPKGKIDFDRDRKKVEWADKFKEAGLGKPPAEVDAALEWRAYRDKYRLDYQKHHHIRGSMTLLDKFASDLNVLVKQKRIDSATANGMYGQAAQAYSHPATKNRVRSALDQLDALYFYGQALTYAGKLLRSKDVEAPS